MPSIQNTIVKKVMRSAKRILFDPSKTIEQHRIDMDKISRMFKVPKQVSFEKFEIEGLKGEWIVPHKILNDGVILYFHGGGYAMGSLDSHRSMMSRLAIAAGSKVKAVDYRLAPENPFPCGLEDAVYSYKRLLDSGISPSKIVFAGDSAGGGLAIVSLVILRDEGIPMPAGCICMSPWTDLQSTGDSYKTKILEDPMIDFGSIIKWAKMYAAEEHHGTPHVSPIHADLSGLPPLYIQVGGAELLLDDSITLAKKAREYGVDVKLEIWESMFHVWQIFGPMLPEAMDALARMGTFVNQKINIDSEKEAGIEQVSDRVISS